MSASILIVDDNPTNLLLASDVLESHGYVIQQAPDAETAWDMIRRTPPDLILMDIALPGMDGLTLTRRIKADPLFSAIPIVVLTASAMKGAEEKALAAGCDAFLTKPIDTRTLPKKVAEQLGRYGKVAGPTPSIAPSPPSVAPDSEPTPRSRSILIVDDIAANRVLLRAVLEDADYSVTEAADGVEALGFLRKTTFAAVISDVLMPNMDGFRLCLEVRKDPALAAIPFIIFTSTYSSPSDRDLALNVGADVYLTKPAPAASILAAIAEASSPVRSRHRANLPSTDEIGVIKQYNTALVSKLEEKNLELEQALERFRQLADNIHEVFWLTDPEKSQILYVSPAYGPIWGRTCESLLAAPQTWLEAIHPDDRERVFEAAHTKQTLGTYDEQYRIIRPDGAIRWVRDRAFPVRDSAGRIYRVAGLAEDQTDKKQLEAQFLRAQRLESIGTLASGIAHDLNNILAPILMSVPMLRWGLPADENEKILANMESSVQRAAALIRQLLTFGRGIEGDRQLVQPRVLLNEIVKIAQQTFPRNITIAADCDEEPCPLFADPTQVHQVLLNLCVNARDAMPEGGTLSLAVTNQSLDSRAAALSADAKPGQYVVIRVADTGTGIPPQHIDKIFDPFFTTKEPGKGTGLGLATVMGIARSHGGFVHLESALGRGTIFSVYFPAARGRIDVEAPPSRQLPPRGNAEWILVVDDEENVRETLRQTLTRHGYQVIMGCNGVDGAAAFAKRQNDIRVVITDLEMPMMSGTTMVQVIKKIDGDAKVIISSGVISHPEMERKRGELKDLGVTEFLSKPYNAPKLLNAVHRALTPV